MTFSLLLSLLIRSGLILGGAALIRRFTHRKHAESRHRILLAGFCLLLVWPLCSAVLPGFAIPLKTPVTSDGRVTIRQTVLLPPHESSEGWIALWPVLLWAAGAFAAILPFLSGYGTVWLSLRKARPMVDPRWLPLLGVSRQPKLLTLEKQRAPFTFGILHPQIVLPAESANWPDQRVRAVLMHELAHIRRNDLAWQALAQLVCAVWWFQPLCWWNRRALRHDSERACDAAAVEAGMRASDYAQELLYIAHTFSKRWNDSYAALSMAGGLEGRLCAILDSPGVRAKRSPWVAIAGVAAITTAASAVTIIPEESAVGAHMTKRTILSGLLASAGLSAATISGSVFDPGGSAVAQAQAQLTNPDTATKQEVTTTTDGKFQFQSLPAGSYILRISKPGFDAVYRGFNVEEDMNVQRAFVIAMREKNPADPEDPEQILLGGKAAESNLITKVQPVYPPDAKAAGVQGTVEMNVVISKEGVPLDIRVLRSPSDELTAATLDAVRQWRYKPTLLNGQPVEIMTDVIVNYTLTGH